ncbi:MAG: cytochrome c biogenesis protein CcdA [Burkholderiales bacterium]|nr:MAG: cytochrome c biogenesis protein CcdA [Betaproteobacteria bacterium]TAG80862.1 MAG: cytochrome c biogenesis protein CcdA [Burkholderiales bacterium]
MDFGFATYSLGYLAGILSTLSPCVLPLLPILISTAITAHRFGPYALALGLTISFTVVGMLIGTVGASLGIDQDIFRYIAAVILMAFGVVLLSTQLQERFATATSGLSTAGDSFLSKLSIDGLKGQFVIGLVLGIIWTPCVGPTLGAATTLASQGKDLAQIALLMLVFGVGAGTPLVILGSVSRATMMKLRGRMLSAGKTGKLLLGGIMILLGIMILTGLDKSFEAWVLSVSPQWLTELTTRY